MNFTSPQVSSNRYVQYHTVFESDDTSTNCNYGSGGTFCSPELKSVTVGPSHYDNSNPSVITKQGINFYSLSNAIESTGSGSCSSGVMYNLGIGSSYLTAMWHYWNGTNWVLSNGTVSTANSVAALNTAALSAFGTQLGSGTVYLKSFLQSSRNTPCQLNSFELDGLS